MPLYDFKDSNTGDVFEKMMSISSKEQYLKENPHIQSYISGMPPLIDPVVLGIRKADNGFKEVLQKIHSRAPGSDLNKTANI
jgi:hypothetical protein